VGVSVNGNSVTTTVKNTGNHHFYGLKNNVWLWDGTPDGTVHPYARIETKPSPYAFIPGSVVNITVKFNETVDQSKYAVISEVVKENSTLSKMPLTKVTPRPSTGNPSGQSQPTTNSKPLTAEGMVIIGIGIVAAIGLVGMWVYHTRK
jgi:hypothetical protein